VSVPCREGHPAGTVTRPLHKQDQGTAPLTVWALLFFGFLLCCNADLLGDVVGGGAPVRGGRSWEKGGAAE